MMRVSYPPLLRVEAAKAALPFCHRSKHKEPATTKDRGPLRSIARPDGVAKDEVALDRLANDAARRPTID
jgi:hypothetical protein